MIVTRNTTVREVIETNRDALAIFEKHGVCVEDECPDAVLDFEIEDCEDMCHIDDIDQLVADLNSFIQKQN
ncbi:MAG: hypothetical protein IPM23_13260 [Candidatus Melainabacteria bacterium]|nr:hypothetical protein [Candidatus Melainabacteria bacterium]